MSDTSGLLRALKSLSSSLEAESVPGKSKYGRLPTGVGSYRMPLMPVSKTMKRRRQHAAAPPPITTPFETIAEGQSKPHVQNKKYNRIEEIYSHIDLVRMKFRLVSFQHVSKDIQPEKDYLHVQDGFSIRDLIKRVALLLSLKTRNNDAHFTLDSTGAKIINIAQILGMRSGETITYCDKGMCKLKFINDTETLPTFVFLVYASSHTGNAPVTLKLRQNISWGMFINLVLKKLQLTETTSGARFTLLANQLKCTRIEDIAKLAGGSKIYVHQNGGKPQSSQTPAPQSDESRITISTSRGKRYERPTPPPRTKSRKSKSFRTNQMSKQMGESHEMRAEWKCLSHILVVGPPGCNYEQLCQKLASEKGFIHISLIDAYKNYILQNEPVEEGVLYTCHTGLSSMTGAKVFELFKMQLTDVARAHLEALDRPCPTNSKLENFLASESRKNDPHLSFQNRLVKLRYIVTGLPLNIEQAKTLCHKIGPPSRVYYNQISKMDATKLFSRSQALLGINGDSVGHNVGGGPSYRRKINSQGCIHMYYKLIQPVLDHFKKLKSLEIVQGLGVTSADDSKGDTIDSHAYSYIRKCLSPQPSTLETKPKINSSIKRSIVLKTTAKPLPKPTISNHAAKGLPINNAIAPPSKTAQKSESGGNLDNEILRWLSSLSIPIPKTILASTHTWKRELSSGFVISQIFSLYFPNELNPHSFAVGTRLAIKRDNWLQLGRFLHKKRIGLSTNEISRIISGSKNAVHAMMHKLYLFLKGYIVFKTAPKFHQETPAMNTARPELSVPESQHVTRRLSSINETYPLTHMDPGLGGYLNAADKQRTAIVDRSDKQGIDLSPIMDGESLQESTSYLEETGGEFSGELSESFLQPLTFN